MFTSLFLKSVWTPPLRGDTWWVSVMTRTLADNGSLSWALSPMSLFGWYPYSYPSGQTILGAALLLVTGLNIISFGYILSGILSLFGLLSFHTLSRIFFRRISKYYNHYFYIRHFIGLRLVVGILSQREVYFYHFILLYFIYY